MAEAIYQRIANEIRLQIVNGELIPGDMLPGTTPAA